MRRTFFTEGFGDLPHFIYAASGPSGVYVGCTIDVKQRACCHRSLARNPDLHNQQTALSLAMRADGEEAYAFEVVACAASYEDGRATERAVIAQLRGSGARVLNRPPTGGRRRHHAITGSAA